MARIRLRSGYVALAVLAWLFAVMQRSSLAQGTVSTLPAGFAAVDIGSMATPGSDTFDPNPFPGTFVISASGADIWDAADAFHFVYRLISGDFDVVTRIDSIDNVSEWTKAGLMVRQRLDAGSRHASIFATPYTTNGVAFQRREFDDGLSVHTSGPPIQAPLRLRLVREGDMVTAYARQTDADPWTVVGAQVLGGLTDPVYVGMAVTSHHDGLNAQAIFRNFAITTLSVPPDWQSTDIGAVGASGTSVASNATTFQIQGSGADIWGTEDAFQYTFTRLTGDGSMIVQPVMRTSPDPWAKAGLMIRESLEPSAAHHMLLVSAANGIAYQRRLAAGEATLHTGLPAGTSTWFRIDRKGASIRLWYSHASRFAATWEFIAEAPFPEGDVFVGMAVTSHAYGAVASATFFDVDVSRGVVPPAWSSHDIGVLKPGGNFISGDRHIVTGSGTDIWGTVDAFRYVFQPLPANGSIVAEVTSISPVNPWAKAGVMIRASTSSSSAHAFMLLSSENGLAFQRRRSLFAQTVHTSGPLGVFPAWLRLTRAGNLVTASYSRDGLTWVDVGTDFIELGDGLALAGLAVTSHDAEQFNQGTFEHVLVQP